MQVSDAITNTDIAACGQAPACKHTGGLQLLSSGRELVPALGLAWANCVNTRLFLSRTQVSISSSQVHLSQDGDSGHAPCSLPLRYMQVVFSPCLPQDTCLYVVTQNGLQGIDKRTVSQAHESSEQHLHADRQVSRQPLAVQQPMPHSHATGGYAMPFSSQTIQQQTMLATGVFATNV